MILSAIVIPWWSLSPYYFPQKENMSPLEKIINILPGRIVWIFGYFNILHNMTQPYLHLFTVSIKSHDLPTFSVQQLFLIFSHSFLKHLMFSPCFAPCFPFQNAERHHSPPLCGYQVLWDAAKMGDAQAIRQVTARPAALAVIGVSRFYSAKNGWFYSDNMDFIWIIPCDFIFSMISMW